MKSIAKGYAAVSVVLHKNGGGNVYKIDGEFDGAADAYLLLLNAKALPANGTTAIWSGVIYGSSPFSFIFDEPIPFTEGLVAAVSTTDATLTISSDTMSLVATLSVSPEWEDKTEYSADDDVILAPWTAAQDSGKARKLYQIRIEDASDDCYVGIMPDTTITEGNPMWKFWAVSAGEVKTIDFGTNGISMWDESQQGECQIVLSTTADVYTAPTTETVDIYAYGDS